MKKILIILVMITYSLCTQAQIIEQIKKEYANLDRQQYIDSLRNWYKNDQISKYNIVKSGTDKEVMRNFYLGYVNPSEELTHSKAEFIRESSWADSLTYVEEINDFNTFLNEPNPSFLLRLEIENQQVNIDTSFFKFDIWWVHVRDLKTKSQSIYMPPSDLCANYSFYPSCSITWKKLVKAIQKILKKNPFCLLSCPQIPGLLYMLNDGIFVFDLSDMKEYEINDYLLLNVGTYKIRPLKYFRFN